MNSHDDLHKKACVARISVKQRGLDLIEERLPAFQSFPVMCTTLPLPEVMGSLRAIANSQWHCAGRNQENAHLFLTLEECELDHSG